MHKSTMLVEYMKKMKNRFFLVAFAHLYIWVWHGLPLNVEKQKNNRV